MFTDRRWTKEEPGYTPAASPRLRRRPSPWPPEPTNVASPEVAHPEVRQARTAPSPDPPGSSWWDTLGGFTHRFLAYSFSSCSPDPPPSDGAGHAPALSGPLATLTGTSRIGLPPASPACCDRPAVVVSHPHSNNQRLTAHPSISPSGILAGHAEHRGPDRRCDWWSAGSSVRVGPASGDELGCQRSSGRSETSRIRRSGIGSSLQRACRRGRTSG